MRNKRARRESVVFLPPGGAVGILFLSGCSVMSVPERPGDSRPWPEAPRRACPQRPLVPAPL